MTQRITWEGIEDKTTEQATIQLQPDSIRAESSITGAGKPDLRYTLMLHHDWTWKEFTLWADGQEVYHLMRNQRTETNTAFIDFNLTPFTNTLPIRKLNLLVGERVAISVLYVCYPPQPVEIVAQEYERLEEDLYRFRHLATGFEADIRVDEYGLVREYATLFTRTG